MPTWGPEEDPRGPAEGPPSARSRDALSDDLRREVADARLRLEEAGLRAEAHRLLGNHDQVLEAADEQRAILAEVEGRLGRVVSRAVVQRDAEHVLARTTHPAPTTPVARPDVPDPADVRRRAPLLSGVASVLAVAAIATAAVLGVTRGMDSVEVVGAAVDVPTADQVDERTPSPDETAASSTPTAVAPSGHGAGASGSDPAPSDVAPSAPEPSDPAETGASPTPDQTATSGPTDDPTDDEDSQLEQAVTDLLDAVVRLGGEAAPSPAPSDGHQPGPDADVSAPDVSAPDPSAPDLEEVLDELGPDGQDGEADGFVPAPSAQ